MAKLSIMKFRDEDIERGKEANRRNSHNQMMDASSVRGGASKNKKAYSRKEKFKKNWA
jgi:hypothetical protein